mmetsp:Transcript_10064/g.8581  ORF Transcript_10064/g.8581 Transcript_10064/m.8581 type:complete len:173 (+) Transcript_10064:64-582(+)
MESKHRIFQSPNGTGGVFMSLSRHHILREMKEIGIKYIQMMGIENVLNKPADPFLIGYTEENNLDCSTKFFLRYDQKEKRPIFVLRNGYPHVAEYSHSTSELFEERKQDGNLKYEHNLLMDTVFSMSFLEEIVAFRRKELAKNYHVKKSRLRYYDESLKETVYPLEDNGYKF